MFIRTPYAGHAADAAATTGRFWPPHPTSRLEAALIGLRPFSRHCIEKLISAPISLGVRHPLEPGNGNEYFCDIYKL